MNEDEGIKKKFQRATKLKLLISHFMSSLKITFSCIVLFFSSQNNAAGKHCLSAFCVKNRTKLS